MSTTLELMAKKKAATEEEKPNGKDGRNPRQTMQIPMPWYSVINRICAHEKQSAQLWAVLELVAKRADEIGIDRPKLPWEEMAG